MSDKAAFRQNDNERQGRRLGGRFSVFLVVFKKRLLGVVVLILILTGIVIWGSMAAFETAKEEKNQLMLAQDGYYEISTAEDYRLFWEMVADGQSDLKGRLMKDIKLNNLKDRRNWRQTPPKNHSIEVGGFTGTFDGNGYTIYGLYSETGYGLVRENFGTIQNVNIRDSLILGEYFAGGICYRNSRIINNCRMSGGLCHNKDNLARMAGIAIVNTGMIETCTYNGMMSFSKNDGDRAGICAENKGRIEGCSNLAEQDMEEVFDEFYHAYAIADEGMDNCYVREGTGWYIPEASHVLPISEDQFYMLTWLREGNCYPLIAREEPLVIGQQQEEVCTACEDSFIFDVMYHLLEREDGNALKIHMQAMEKEEGDDCIFAVKLTITGQSLEIKAYLAEENNENYGMPVEHIAEILGEAGESHENDDRVNSWEHRTYQLTQLPERTRSQLYWIEAKTVPENLMLYRTKWETGFWYRRGEMLYQIILPEKEMSQGTAEVWEKLTAAAGKGKEPEHRTKKLLWYKILNQLYAEREVSDGISWKDEAIRKAVYKELSEDGQTEELIFSTEEIMGLEELSIEDAGDVGSYYDLQYLPKLTSLKLYGGTAPIAQIDAPLTSLRLEGCYIRNPECIGYFPDLSELEIVDSSGLDDFAFLEDLPQLKQLSIESYAVRLDSMMNAVSKCKMLERLSLRSNGLFNIEKLSKMTNLRELDLSFNKIIDFSPLYELHSLCKLSVNDNPGKELGRLVYIPDLSIGSQLRSVEELDKAQQVLDEWYPDNCLLAEGFFYRDIKARDVAWGDFNADGIRDLAVIGEGKETLDQEWNLASPAQRKIYLFQGTKDGFEEVQTISLPGPSLTEAGDWEEGPVSYIAISGNHLLAQTKGSADDVSGGWNSISVYTWTEGRMEPDCRHETDY